MANNKEEFSAEINLNTQNARNKIKELEKDLAHERQVLQVLTKDEQKHSQEIFETQKRIGKLTNELGTQKAAVLGLSKSLSDLSRSSYKDLQKEARALTKILQSGKIEKGSEEWKSYAQRIRECKEEMSKFNEATKTQTSIWERIPGFLNKNFGAISQIIGGLTGISVSAQKMVDAYAQMQQEMADVRKYTGQTAEEVERMNEDFKKMDTRTAREELNQLAGAAGRLGITATDKIEEFVDAADKIGVALGDDLGKGAVDTIGKLAIAFGEDSRLGLRGAMLATGSALNEIAGNSSAAAGNVVEFTKAISGVGQQANITVANLMGFGSVLDQNNQEMATSATVMSQLITKIYQDPARFAKMAGMEVKGFADLVKRDMNAALVEWLKHVNALGDMSVLASSFDELKMDGTRAIGVISTLAGHVDQLVEAQKVATDGYREATSVIEEFNTQNTTVQAGLDKAKARLHEVAIELGGKLEPAAKFAVGSATLLVKTLGILASFLLNNQKVILTTAAVIAAYNAKLIVLTAVEKSHGAILAVKNGLQATSNALTATGATVINLLKLAYAKLTGNIVAATAAQNALNVSMKGNVFGLVLAGIVAAGAAITSYRDKVSKQRAEERRLRDEQEAAAKARKAERDSLGREELKQKSEEILKVQQLTKKIHDNTLSVDERKKAIGELQKIVPNYHAKITEGGNLYERNKQLIDEYIAGLKQAAIAEAAYAKMVKLQGEALDFEAQNEDLKKQQQNEASKKILKKDEVMKTVHRRGTDGREYTETVAHNTKTGKDRTLTDYEVEQYLRAQNNAKKLGEQIAANEKKQQEINDEVEFYNKKMEEARKNQAAAQKKTGAEGLKNNSETVSSATKGKTEKELKEEAKRAKKEETERRKQLKENADTVKADYQAQLAQEMLSYRKGEIAYSQYMENKHRITQDYYDRMKGIYGEDSNEYKKMLDDREREESDYYQYKNKKGEDEIVLARMKREHDLQMQFLSDKSSAAYQNEEALNEALFQSDMEYMRAMRDLHHAGSKEWEEWDTRMKGEEVKHKFELEENYQRKLQQYRHDFGLMSAKELEDIELKSVETLYQTLRIQGKMTEEEYKRIVSEIKKSYAELDASQTADKSIRSRGSKVLETASKAAGPLIQSSGGDLASSIFNIGSAIANQKAVNDKLKELYEEDAITQEEFEEAKRQNAMQTSQVIMASASAALQEINNMLGSVSAYMQACSNLEVAQIQKNYDAQIEAAGKNSKKREKLEKKRDEEIAKAKTKASKKAMAMEMAQAVASTAMAAINAYSSAAQTPVVGWTLAPIAAGLALAAGAIQIATIKKQHQAEQAGYYEGGFTGGRRYKKQAGVVHEGEFVANHQAVNNPQLAPFFSLIDQAQRNNKVASLTASDVTSAIGGPTSVTPIVNVVNDNSEINDSLYGVRDVMQSLSDQLKVPIEAVVSFDDLKKKWDHNNRLLNNK